MEPTGRVSGGWCGGPCGHQSSQHSAVTSPARHLQISLATSHSRVLPSQSLSQSVSQSVSQALSLFLTGGEKLFPAALAELTPPGRPRPLPAVCCGGGCGGGGGGGWCGLVWGASHAEDGAKVEEEGEGHGR